MKDLIYRSAIDLGFFAVGVASAERLPELDHLNSWLKKNFDATMSWMRKDPALRCDPSSLLAGAKSVICVAHEYRFARGRDYHKIVKKKLIRVVDALKTKVPNARFKTCVDTSPVLEKALAVRSGIGWRGKHSIVIHPDRGSYFVLGEIITDIEIEPDKPVENRCGDCNKCIEACPTGTIVEPYIIDANRCISYLTIEHEGPIDRKLTKHIKPEQYGCELCQEACPYNKGE